MQLNVVLLRIAIGAIVFIFKFEASAANVTQAEQVIELIRDGLQDQPAHPSGRAIVLIGLTGSGKTTLAKFITGDNNRLVSVAVPSQTESTPCPEPDPNDDYYDYGYPIDCEPEERAKEYYIKDLDDNKIGNDITVSKTFYPEVYADETTGEVLVDCPGFADTRSESHEIAIAVFMKNIFKWAKQTKILVVVNHGDVTRTGGRNEFQNLLRFVTILLKNFEKFNSSLGLVATKVTNEYNSQQKLFGDEAMITQIADFLASVQAELVQQDPADPRVQVLVSLLKQIGRLYPSIGIFRRPYEKGPLETITAIQTGKKKIRKMLFSNLDYTNSSDSDIGFAISPASEAVVIDLCEMIIGDIDALLDRLHVDFTGYYKAVVNDSQNYEQLSGVLKQDSGRFKPFNLNQKAGLEDQLKWFVDVLVGNSAPSYLPIRSTIEAIRNQTTYLDFLKDLTSSPKVAPKESWKTQVKALVEYVQDLSEWYEFLMHAFNRMAQNDFQSRKATFSLNNLKHWPLFKSLVFDNLKWPSNPSVQRKSSLKDHEKKSLEDVLYVVLDPVHGRALFPSPDACELVMEGNFVRISDFEKLVKLCGGRNITATYLFAQYTVFFDSSLSKQGSELLFGVVAPKWEVVGSQKITLTGHNGEKLLQSQNRTGDGIAGYPGRPSGTFFGTGVEFTNAAALQIYASGGTGGPGQMGNNGTDGHGDVDPNVIHKRACDHKLYSGTCARRTYDFSLERINYKMDQSKCTRCKGCCPEYTVQFSIIDGPSPTIGFKGGKQGLGGRHSTSTQIIGLRGQPGVQLHSADGSPGLVGLGGKGGLGGVKNGVYTAQVDLKCMAAALYGVMNCKRLNIEPGTRAKSAKDGLSNVSGIQLRPKPAKNHETYPIISKYRLFMANQWLRKEKPINNKDLEYVEKISVNPKIQELIDLPSLTFEFLALEDLRRKNPVSSQWLPALGLLLESAELANQTKMYSRREYTIVANYLGAAILSRKLSIEYQFDKNLIVDLRLFLNEVSKQINMLAKLDQAAKLKALKTMYSQDIIKKQEQADLFLNQQFEQEMGIVESKIDQAINGLLTEVTDLLGQLEADRQKLVSSIKKAQAKFALNIIFGFLGVVSQFVKMVGPKGNVIGTVLDVGVDVGKKFTQSGSGVPNTKIPKAVKALDEMTRYLDMKNKEKIRLLESKFNNVTSGNPLEQRVLAGAKPKLSELIRKPIQFSTVQTELTATIQNLRKTNGIEESDLLDKVETLILLSKPEDAAAYDRLYLEIKRSSKMRSSSAEIEELQKELKEVEANIKKVAAYERFVDESLSDYLKNLTELMVSVKNGARQSSAITLEISRYNIQKVLQEVRMIINKYTSGFNANEELILCIDMLDNLMRTTINIYDQIQKYNDQLNLGDLIVGIDEAALTGPISNNTRLNAAIQELDHKVVSNTIQNQYARVLQAFHQLVFPFAPLFLPTVQISGFGPDSTKDGEMMQLIISKINNLQSIINNMQSSVIAGYDDQLFTFNFDEKQPFYVWNEVEHEQKITALLQGNEVAFKANVANSVASAVKFNNIRLQFVATNASEQIELARNLRFLNIRLTHLGNSQYKCGSRFYVISHQPQDIEMSVKTDEFGEPLSSNAVYKKIRAGDILLSPYTVWKFKLVDRFKASFDLSNFFGKVQLKLTGRGQYVKETNPICNQSLERFYQLDQIN